MVRYTSVFDSFVLYPSSIGVTLFWFSTTDECIGKEHPLQRLNEVFLQLTLSSIHHL